MVSRKRCVIVDRTVKNRNIEAPKAALESRDQEERRDMFDNVKEVVVVAGIGFELENVATNAARSKDDEK